MSFNKQSEPVTCDSDLTFSAQASSFHYCEPRNDVGPYTKVEIGFPSERGESFMPYIDGCENVDPTDTVYCRVPIQVVLDVIKANGGQVGGELPPH